METKAKLSDISYTPEGKQRLCFTLDRRVDTDSLDGDLRLKAVKWREKRSLNANSYFHVLVGKIAEKTGQSRTEVHNQLISDYGRVEMNDDHVMDIIMDAEVDWRKVESLHLHPTTARRVMDNGRVYQVYLVMRGSHTYDTQEMSHLIEWTIAEAENLGIETVTPDEKARMLQQWKVS